MHGRGDQDGAVAVAKRDYVGRGRHIDGVDPGGDDLHVKGGGFFQIGFAQGFVGHFDVGQLPAVGLLQGSDGASQFLAAGIDDPPVVEDALVQAVEIPGGQDWPHDFFEIFPGYVGQAGAGGGFSGKAPFFVEGDPGALAGKDVGQAQAAGAGSENLKPETLQPGPGGGFFCEEGLNGPKAGLGFFVGEAVGQVLQGLHRALGEPDEGRGFIIGVQLGDGSSGFFEAFPERNPGVPAQNGEGGLLEFDV